jgi:hypothetical protein
MGKAIDYEEAKRILLEEFRNAETDYLAGKPVAAPENIKNSTIKLFESRTQAFREVLVGCLLARIINPQINIRLVYVSQGENAFSGRSLDEKVVNPFLQSTSIPCSKGPYLSVLRRSIRLVPETASGLRDRKAYNALLEFLDYIEIADQNAARGCLRFLHYHFIALRESANIPMANIQRLSLEQLDSLISGLLEERSGGLVPLLMAVAMFKSLIDLFELDWKIEWQKINVADKASQAGGDITIRHDGEVILAIEITERQVDEPRLVSTFTTKIAPYGIQDYLFLFSAILPSESARTAARKYFAQGHDINFLQIKDWLIHLLGALGIRGRRLFVNNFLQLLSEPGVPASLKVAWNDRIKSLF